jgi:hypothetical protein
MDVSPAPSGGLVDSLEEGGALGQLIHQDLAMP